MPSFGVNISIACGITRPSLRSRYSRSLPSCCWLGTMEKSGSNWRTPTSAAASIPEVALVVSFACACKVVGRASAIAPAARSRAAPHEMCFMESLLVGSMLPVEIGTVRMVRAVDVEVTGGALAVEHELHVGGERGAARRDRVPAAGMALLAKPRTRHLQHLLVGRA